MSLPERIQENPMEEWYTGIKMIELEDCTKEQLENYIHVYSTKLRRKHGQRVAAKRRREEKLVVS